MENKKLIKRFVMTSTFAGAFLAAPVIGEAALGDQTLKEGSTHQDVQQLQSLLKNIGFFNYHETTTYFGPVTKKAVMDFQRANGLVVDGIVGKNTYSKLLEKSHQEEKPAETKPSSSVAKPPVSSPSEKVLKLNSTGKEVKRLQDDLKFLGFFTFYKTTEYYGTITTEAVRKFQISQKLKATGVADATTIDRIQTQVAAKRNPSTPAPAPSQTKPNPSTPAPPQTDTVQLKFGSKGPEVIQLQTRLKNLGYFTYPMITDYFGTVTEESVEKFQKANGLAVTGIVTTEFLNKITEVEKKQVQQPVVTRNQITINVIANASELMGVPYQWGGTTTKGFDCSGFIQYVFAKEGISLPRTTAQMWNATTKVSQPEVGDLVFFETYTTGPSHLGIYIGNNQFVHSGSSTGVTVSNLTLPYWQNIYLGSKRVNY